MKNLTKKVSLGIFAVLFAVCSLLGIAMISGNTVKTDAATQTPTVTFVGVKEGQNYDGWVGSHAFLATFLVFDGPTFTAGQFTTSGAPVVDGIYYEGPAYNGRRHFDFVWIEATRVDTSGTNFAGLNVIELLNSASNPIEEGSVLHVVAGTSLAGQVLPEITLRLIGNQWVEYKTPTVTFTGIDATWNNKDYPFNSAYSSTILFFSKTLFDGFDADHGGSPAATVSLGDGNTSIAWSMKIDGVIAYSKEVIVSKNFYAVWGATKGGLEFYLPKANFTTGSILTIAEGTEISGQVLPQVTLRFDGTKWVEGKVDVSSTPWFNAPYGDGGQYGIGLTTGAYNFTTQQFCDFSGFWINGNAVGSGILWAEGQILPLFDQATHLVGGVNGYDYPTFEIKDGAKAVGSSDGLTVYFKPLTLYYIGGAWTPNYTPVEFTDIATPWFHQAYDSDYGLGLRLNTLYSASAKNKPLTSYSGITYNGGALTHILNWNNAAQGCGQTGILFVMPIDNGAPKLTNGYDYPTLNIAEGAVITLASGETFHLAPATYYFDNGSWTTIEPSTLVFTGMSSSYNHGTYPFGDGVYNAEVLEFSKPLYTDKAQAVNLAIYSDLANGMKINGTAITSVLSPNITRNVLGKNGGIEIYYKKADFPTFSATTRSIVLTIDEGTTFLGNELPAVTLYFNGTNWQTEPYEIPLATLTEIASAFNNADAPWASTTLYLTGLTFDKVLSVAGVGDTTTSALGNALKLNGTSVNSLGWILSAPGNGTGMNVQYPKAGFPSLSTETTQVKLELTEAVLFGDVTISPFTLYLNASNQWQVEEFTMVYTEVTFDSMPYNQSTPFANNHYYNVLKFDKKLYADSASGNAVLAPLVNSIKLNGNSIANLVMTPDENGNLGFQIPFTSMPSFDSSVKQIVLTIEEGTVCGNFILPAVTLYFNGSGWQTEEYSVSDASFTGILSNMGASTWGADQRLLILSFSKPIAPISTSIQGSERYGTLNGSGNIRSNITLNGNPFTENVLFYVNTFYSVLDTESNAIELLFTNYGSGLTFNNGDVLRIPQGTHIGDVILGEVVLTFNGTTWDYEAAENPLVKLEWNDNGYNAYVEENTILLRYTSQINGTANEEDIDIKASLEGFLTINGVDITAIEGAEVIIPGGYGGIFILIRGIDAYRVNGSVFELKEVNVFKSKLPALTLTYNTSFGTDEGKWCYPVTVSMNGVNKTAYVGADTEMIVTPEALKVLFNAKTNVSFSSYTIGATDYNPNKTVLITAPTSVTINGAVLFGTETGASIRVDSNYDISGIRFETRIDYVSFENLIAEYDSVITGTYILPASFLANYEGSLYNYLTDNSKSSANNDYVDIVNDGFYNRETAESDGYYKYYGSLVKLQDNNFVRDFIGVGYIKLVKGGETTLILGGDGSNTTRSIYYVAKRAYLDTTDGCLTDASKEIIRNHYIEKVVEINGAGALAPVAEYTVLSKTLDYSPVNYGLDYDANGVFTITAVGKICAVIVDGVNLGSISAGVIKYLPYFDGKKLVDVKPDAGLKYGFGEPTQELWGTQGSANWSADSKTASMWKTDRVNAYSTAENVATVSSAFGGNSARIWMHTDELCIPNALEDANYLLPGALAVVKEVIADFKAQGVTNISFQTSFVNTRATLNYYSKADDAWYSFWQVIGKEGTNPAPYCGLATLPGDDGSVSGLRYAQFLDLQEKYFTQLLNEIGDDITCIEILNEVELGKLIFRQGVEATENNDQSRLNGLTVDKIAQVVMDVCFRASKAVKASGKDVKILMPALACIDGNGIDPSKGTGFGFNSNTLFTAEYNYIKNQGLANNGSNNPDDYFQFINMHPYVLLSKGTSTTNYLYDNKNRQDVSTITERWIAYVNSLRQIAADNGDGDKPIWITEFGMADYGTTGDRKGINTTAWSDYKNNTLTRQTEVFNAIIGAVKNMPCFDTFIFFRLGDYELTNPTSGAEFAEYGEASYGIIDKNGDLKDIGKNLYTILTGSSDYSGITSAVAGIKG